MDRCRTQLSHHVGRRCGVLILVKKGSLSAFASLGPRDLTSDRFRRNFARPPSRCAKHSLAIRPNYFSAASQISENSFVNLAWQNS